MSVLTHLLAAMVGGTVGVQLTQLAGTSAAANSPTEEGD